jgi:hypothetical protein
MMRGRGRPSPAMVVATVALIVALSGTAVGAAFITKKKAKKVANAAITKRAPGLSVANAKTANGLADSSFQIQAWAKVTSEGTLASGKNVSVIPGGSQGRYCFDLPFAANGAVATVAADEGLPADGIAFFVPDSSGQCPASHRDARAFTSNEAGGDKDVGFWVWFN